jgi:hypothetical protein
MLNEALDEVTAMYVPSDAILAEMVQVPTPTKATTPLVVPIVQTDVVELV